MSVAYNDSLRASRRLTGFLLFVIGVGLTIGLFYVKTRARTATNDVRTLERQIATEQSAIDVLHAEIAFLGSPARLAAIGEARLGLAPTDPANLVSASAILDIPLRQQPAPVEGTTDE